MNYPVIQNLLSGRGGPISYKKQAASEPNADSIAWWGTLREAEEISRQTNSRITQADRTIDNGHVLASKEGHGNTVYHPEC